MFYVWHGCLNLSFSSNKCELAGKTGSYAVYEGQQRLFLRDLDLLMATVEVYARPMCPYCTRPKSLLDSKGIKYAEYNIWEDTARKPEMVKRTNGGSSVPQIFINDDHVGGCDELMTLERAGNLDLLLKLDA